MSLCDDAVKAVQNYRNSWVELGRILNELAYGGDFRDLGYEDLADFCAKKLGLKKATAQKLMISYNYMKKHEKKKLEAVEKGESVILPSHETIALLDKVQRRETASEEDLNELRFQAFSKPITDDSQKEFKKRAAPRKQVDPDIAEKNKVLKTARDLRRAMSATHFVPDGLRERIEQPLVELEALAG